MQELGTMTLPILSGFRSDCRNWLVIKSHSAHILRVSAYDDTTGYKEILLEDLLEIAPRGEARIAVDDEMGLIRIFLDSEADGDTVPEILFIANENAIKAIKGPEAYEMTAV